MGVFSMGCSVRWRSICLAERARFTAIGDKGSTRTGAQIDAGRYGNASEVVRAGLRLVEEHEQKVEALRKALEDGAETGDSES